MRSYLLALALVAIGCSRGSVGTDKDLGSGDSDDTPDVDTTPRELRRIWVTRWTYSSEEDITSLLQRYLKYWFQQRLFLDPRQLLRLL